MKPKKSQTSQQKHQENEIAESEDSFIPDEQPTGGESVIVALMLRSMNNTEGNRGDNQDCQLLQKFNYVMDKKSSQSMKEEIPERTAHEKEEIEVSLKKIVQQYEFETSRLENENVELRNTKEIEEKNFSLFQMTITHDKESYKTLSSCSEKAHTAKRTSIKNKMMRNKISDLEDEIFEFKQLNIKNNLKQTMAMSMEEKEIRVINRSLKDRFLSLKNKELELMNLINKKANEEAKDPKEVKKGTKKGK